MTLSNIIVEEKTPTAFEHYHLRREASLTPPPQDINEEALKKSFYCVTLRDSARGNEAIGMGRIVGDGMLLFLVDMAILPAYQKRDWEA